MSEDARNSIYLWASTLVLLGGAWASLHFNLLDGVSNTWLWSVLWVVMVINLVQTIWGFWQRRASNPKNPNRR